MGEEVNSSCGHACFIIGGPFIAEDPSCPTHGTLHLRESLTDQRSESDLFMAVLSRLPEGWEVRISTEENDEGDLFLTATVWADSDEEELPYEGLLFGVSVEDGNFTQLAKLLREAIVRDKRIVLREIRKP